MESLYIDGEYVTSSTAAAIEVENPATEEVITEVPDADAADIDRAVEAARRAQREWRAVDGLERAGVLHRCADRLEDWLKKVPRPGACEPGGSRHTTCREGPPGF